MIPWFLSSGQKTARNTMRNHLWLGHSAIPSSDHTVTSQAKVNCEAIFTVPLS